MDEKSRGLKWQAFITIGETPKWQLYGYQTMT
jgi:hypothetical protein